MPLACRAAVTAALLLHAASAAAVDVGDGRLSLNGNGSWGYLVVKASVHRADGLRFVGPRDDLSAPSGSTFLVVAGAQFTF